MHMPKRRAVLVRSILAVFLSIGLGSPARLVGQTPPRPATPSVNISGLIFGNYQYHLSGQNQEFNQFALDRAYINVRATVSERMSARVTSDVFQSGDGNGWTIRAKYAYIQYDYLKRPSWSGVFRAGMLQNVMVENVEQFWPRFLSPVALERSGGFASADVGAATLVTLPQRWGELYAHVVNGPGYTRRESDRFKDFGARLTLTPLAGRASGLLSTLMISPWFYEGAIASTFVRGGGGGAIAPVGAGLPRDRYGVVAGVRDPRLTLAGEVARMRTVTDALGPGTIPTRVVSDARANIWSAHGILRPLAFGRADRASRFGIVGRYDGVEPNTATDERYHFLIAGILIDVNARSTLAFDYQEQLANDGAPALPAPGAFRALFAHIVVNF
jgi:hypothetical protein